VDAAGAVPPSERLGKSVFGCGDGVYLITRWSDPDQRVRAVGWAESDYWAQRAWVTPFPGGLEAPAPQWGPPPSLGFLGRPEVTEGTFGQPPLRAAAPRLRRYRRQSS
jgi:hypothetical protein